MKKLLLILLFVPLIFSCGENYEKENNQKETKRPKSFLELWKVKGNVKSAEYTMYSVSEKFGEIQKEYIIVDPLFDSDEWLFGNKKSIFNKFGDIKKISIYNNDGDEIGGGVCGFNSDEILVSFSWEDKRNLKQGRGEFKLYSDDYSMRFYGYNENSNLTSIEIYKRNKDCRIIKISTFYSLTSWSNEKFEDEVLRNKLEPDLLLEWKYDATGNWIETSRYINNELVSAKIAQLALLTQGKVEAKMRVINMVNTMDNEGFGSCTNTGACEVECPKGISLDNIARINREMIKIYF